MQCCAEGVEEGATRLHIVGKHRQTVARLDSPLHSGVMPVMYVNGWRRHAA